VRKPTLKKPQPLTASIIAYMQPGEERADGQCAGLRVRCLGSGEKVFFYRYRARDEALREICYSADLRHEATSRLFERAKLSDIQIFRITDHTTPRALSR